MVQYVAKKPQLSYLFRNLPEQLTNVCQEGPEVWKFMFCMVLICTVQEASGSLRIQLGTIQATDSEYALAGTPNAECMVLEDKTVVSKQGVRLFLKCYQDTHTILRKPGSGLSLKLSPNLKQLIEDIMQLHDEITIERDY